MRRPLLLLAALSVTACADNAPTVRTTEPSVPTSASAATSSVATTSPPSGDGSEATPFCAAVFSLRDQERQPDLASLVPLDRAVVEARVAASDAAIAAVVRAAEDVTYADDLARLATARRSIGEALVKAWGADGVELLRDADADGRHISEYPSRDGIDVGDDVLSVGAYRELDSEVAEQTSWSCDERPADWVAVSELPPAQVPTDLRYLMVMNPSDELTLMVGSASVPVLPVPIAEPNLEFTSPIVSPDGEWFATVGFGDGNPDRAFLGRFDAFGPVEQISPTDESWTCLSWSPDAGSITTTRRVADGRWKQSRFDVGTGETVDLLDGEFATREMPCGAFLDDDTLLVIDTHDETGAPSVWRQDVGSDERELFVSIPDCSTIDPQVRPGTGDVAVITACANIYDAGLWIVDDAASEPRHVLRGLIGAPTWSDDGEWIMFGYQEDRAATPELWMASADGSSASQLVSGWSSWPAWIPAATECVWCPG